MARINIEDDLYKDKRFIKLNIKLGSIEMALGALVRAWSVAQKFYLTDEKMIPLKEWKKQELNDEIINCGLAKIENNFVRIAGADEQFAWLKQKKQAGKKGGEKSAIARKTKRKSLESLRMKHNQAEPSEGKRDEAGSSGVKPLTQSLSLTHTQSLNNNLISNEIKAKAKPSPKVDENLNKKTNLLLAKYCLLFKQKYNSNFKPTGKMVGIAKRLAKDFTEDKMQNLLEAFFQLPDAYLVKRRHPIELLEQKLNEVLVFMETGNFVTQRTTQQMDDMATNMSLLNKIRSKGNE